MDYHERIRNLREGLDLNQTEVAKLVFVDQRTYSSYETGRLRIPLDVVIALARFYDVDMDYICGLTDKPEPFKEVKR